MSDSGNPASIPSCSGFRSGPERTGSAEQSRVWSLSSSSQRGRLPSLRTRDLTLGGAVRKTKPLFDPATFPRLQAENPVAPKKEKRERDAKRKESRGGRKARPQVIQSHSIFEQCPEKQPKMITFLSTQLLSLELHCVTLTKTIYFWHIC
uniref:Uncharacterized protein n=1 Tax=Xiphophorus couchianus TaxID=32473 RepID=A0A3B5MFZ8_9TELE